MDLIKKLTTELDTEMNRVYSEYIDLHRELDTHRGIPITDVNEAEVNRLLIAIQEKFGSLYSVFHFVGHRYEFTVTCVDQYNQFIDGLKAAGASLNGQPVESDNPLIRPN